MDPQTNPTPENTETDNNPSVPSVDQPSGTVPSVPPEPAALAGTPTETAPPTDPTQLVVPQPPAGLSPAGPAPKPAKKNKILFKILLALAVAILGAVAIVALLR